MKIKYKHTNIISKEWYPLAQFYIQVFDCKIVPPERDHSGDWLSHGTGVSEAVLKGAHLLLPGFGEDGPTLEIYEYNKVVDRDIGPANEKGFGHIAFEVEDVGAVLQEVLANGGSSEGELAQNKIDGLGILTFVYARDPDGNLIELQQWKLDN